MLPKFPIFKNLELSDRVDIEHITTRYLPYSDFNFVSMWSWDIEGDVKVSELNENLVMKFDDYLNGKQFYTFIGTNRVNETVQELLDLSISNKIKPQLKLIPEVSIKGLHTEKFSIEEDRDSFDYVYSVKKLLSFIGSEYSNHRRLLRHFTQDNKNIKVEELNLASVKNRMQVLQLNNKWKANKELDFENDNESRALIRMLNSAEYLSLINLGVFVNDELVAFTINEKRTGRYIISYFAKFNTHYKGAYLYSMQKTAEYLFKEGCEFINCEQDLGLAGLRYSKQALGPVEFLKKYKVSYKKGVV